MYASIPHSNENPRVRAMRAGANAARGIPTSASEWQDIRRGYERMQQSVDHLPAQAQDCFWHPWRPGCSSVGQEPALDVPDVDPRLAQAVVGGVLGYWIGRAGGGIAGAIVGVVAGYNFKLPTF